MKTHVPLRRFMPPLIAIMATCAAGIVWQWWTIILAFAIWLAMVYLSVRMLLRTPKS
jgi:hypothetical protein